MFHKLISSFLKFPHQIVLYNQAKGLHTTAISKVISRWPDENEWVYPPQKPGEPRRPAVSFFSYYSLFCLIYLLL